VTPARRTLASAFASLSALRRLPPDRCVFSEPLRLLALNRRIICADALRRLAVKRRGCAGQMRRLGLTRRL